jgi:adenylosuccinate lyase
MNDRRVHPNATAIDSDIYSDIFSTSAMREVWSDRSRIQYYLDFEKALALSQANLGVISIAVSQGKGRLIGLLSNDPEIVQILDRSAIEGLMEPTNYLGNSGAMVDRVLAGRRD